MTEKRVLLLILSIFILLGIVYAVITPVFEASDELWHYPMIRHLADGNPLPVQVFDPGDAGPWKQEASQPPLYYYLGAILTFWIDTSDIENVRWLNPHVDNGVLTSDGNINLVVHDPNADPLTGTQLAVHIVRFFSVFLGALTVYLTYKIAREAAPGRPEIALGAAAVNAFTPMFLFISGAVNNDNLVIPLSSLALLMMIRIVQAYDVSNRQKIYRLIVLGIVIGLGALTKITAFGLFALASLAIFISQWVTGGRGTGLSTLFKIIWQTLLRLVLVIVPAMIIAGWWYFRNIQLYGDWSGWNAFIAVLGQRAHPASLAQLWDERWGFMLSYWGLFGGLNVPMPEWIYHLLNAVVIVSVAGFFVYGGKLLFEWRATSGTRISRIKDLLFNLLAFTERYFALILCLLWALAVIVGLVRWATITWSSQGRLVFSSISALSTLLVIGLVGWLPRRLARIGGASLSVFLIVVSTLAPIMWIKPAYEVEDTKQINEFRVANVVFDDNIRLVGYQVDKNSIKPGDELNITLMWEVLREMQRDWSVFVHLADTSIGIPVAQRDMFPGQGLLSTRLFKPGESFTNHYSLQIPETAIAPEDLKLVTGLYNFSDGERMKVKDGRDFIELETIKLGAKEGGLPNPISVNFENELELIGFTVGPRRVKSSDELQLTLFWRAMRPLNKDYTFFAQVVDQDTTRWASQDLSQNTRNWSPEEIHELDMELKLSSDVPPGIYPIIIGVYSRPLEGGFERLQMVTGEGRLTDDFLPLADLRIESP